MTSRPADPTDPRNIAEGLTINVSITRPMLITATGREAPSRHAIVPPGTSTVLGLLPYVDYVDDVARRPGCGFVGGRISAFAPFLRPGSIPAPTHLQVTLRTLPDSRDAILRDLRSRAGLWSAPGALFIRSAWADIFVANWMDALRQNGDGAQLVLAHAQAMLATRKMWLAVEWNWGVPKDVELTIASGAAAVGRALIDVVTLIDRLATPKRAETARPAHHEAVLAALLTALGHFLRRLRAAETAARPKVGLGKLKLAVRWARTILNAVGLFSVSDDQPRKRWQRMTNMLGVKQVPAHAGPAEPKLARLSRELEQLECARLGHRLEQTGWRQHIRRSLLRLASSDRSVRLQRLARIRCDLIYALATTGQLERLYRLFPWLAALHGGFPGCAGGALGALASLYEAGRGVEIGGDMARRLGDPNVGLGMVPRVTVRSARQVYKVAAHISHAIAHRHAVGASFVSQVFSHVTVKAGVEGRSYGGDLSLEEIGRGNLRYNDHLALQVPYTRDQVLVVHQDQPVFGIVSRDDDLIRHMGLTLVRLLFAIVHSIWPTGGQRDDFNHHRAIVDSGRTSEEAKGGGTWRSFAKYRIHLEIVRSMLRTVDGEIDDSVRDPIADVEAPPASGREGTRADKLGKASRRKTGAWAESDLGQGAVRNAGHEAINSDDRGEILRDLVEDVRCWRLRDPKKPRPAPADDLFEDIMLGRANLVQLKPVSDLFIPILWFAPLIDRDRLAWIARGMPGQAVGGDRAQPAARLKSWLEGVKSWSPAPFALPIVSGRDDVIACHLFTGVSPITADLAHVR